MTTNETRYYLIESSGETRAVWGPYATPAAAKRAAGLRHFVAQGDHAELRHGGRLTRIALRTALQTGAVRPADGSSVSAMIS